MDVTAKYIVVLMRTGFSGEWEEHLIPFGSRIVHADMAENFGKSKVVSAGFIQFDENGIHCYGRSESLGKDSRPEDLTLAKNAFGDWK